MERIRDRWGAAFLPGLAALLFAGLTGGANAQITSEQQSAIRANCRSDFMSKCSGVTPGSKDALVCLQKNVASLAPACKTAVSATIPPPAPASATATPAQATSAPAAAAAAPAVASPAPAPVQPTITQAAPPPATASLRPAPKPKQESKQQPKQAQKPEAPPKQAVAAAPAAAAPTNEAAAEPTPQQMSAIKFTCRRDFKVHCRGLQPGGAETIACLQRNAAKLAPDCKTSLAAIGDAVPVTPAGAVAPPPASRRPNAPVVMTAVIGRACLRDLVRRCRGVGVGDGEKIACLLAHGPSLAPLCKAALKITEPVR